MYYYIKGTLEKKGENYVVVEANGVGYMIYTSLTSINAAPATGGAVTMYTYLHVREDVMDLYGFVTNDEKNMFLKLLGVSGVGPKAALAVLSVVTPPALAAAVITNDVKAITKAQGVGGKMAQRIILELKDKIDAQELDIPAGEENAVVSGNRDEAVKALVALGYSVQEAKKATDGIDGSLSVEEIIKKALAALF